MRLSKFFGDPQRALPAADYARALQGLEGRRPSLDALPIEAARMARGLLTSKALAAGRACPWPQAFTRQLDPGDPGFIPRSLLPFVLNQSYRDWVALGLPDHDNEALVDPAGWLTPVRNGPSVAVWVGDSRNLWTLGPLPGWGEDNECDVSQTRDGPVVHTVATRGDVRVEVDCFPTVIEGRLVFGITARVRLLAPAPRPVRVGFAIRPANPQGVAPIFDLERRGDGWWLVNGEPFALVPHAGHELRLSSWAAGDVYGMLGGALRQGPRRRRDSDARQKLRCPAGLATGAELYRVNLSPDDTFKRTLYCSAEDSVGEVLRRSSASRLLQGAKADWTGTLRSGTRVELPCYGRLFDQARTSLLALTDRSNVTCGPAEHRFMPGGAALHLAALVRLGHRHRAARVLRGFPSRSLKGTDLAKALWTCSDHLHQTGDEALRRELTPWMLKKARGLQKAEIAEEAPLIDHIWACAALREASEMALQAGQKGARDLGLEAATRLEDIRARLGEGPVAARPGGDLDSSAVRVLVACWPLGLLPADDPALQSTLAWLLKHCMHRGGLFHDVEHAGINPVMTAVIAQLQLRSGVDPQPHVEYLAEHASGAGTWPEAFHPGRGGVLGEGDHAPAAAAFVLLIRDLLVREEGDVLHLFHEADPRWWQGHVVLEGLPTRFGPIDLQAADGRVRLRGIWRSPPADIVCHAPLELVVTR